MEAYSITKETRETRETSGISITTLKAGITGITKTPASTGTATSTTTAASGYWIDEKIKLTRLLEEKNSKIAELEKKTLQIEQEHRSKVAILEHEKRKAEGTKNRVEIEADNTRKLLQIERGKTDEALEQMNKLVFFEDDLIHARDYNRLKQEMEEVLRENAAMFQDHQRYIIEVAQNRRQMTNRLEELEAELASLKLEAV